MATLTNFIDCPGSDRLHHVYRYTDQIYKIVQFYRPPSSIKGLYRDCSQFDHYEHKLDASVSRAKSTILELALCNTWDYFCTFTIAKNNFDRNDLSGWREKFTQFLRDQRKKGFEIQYLLIPEQHADGSWHAHGLLSGLPRHCLESFKDMDKRGYRSSEGRRLPCKLRHSDYMNWDAYMARFGFCSLGDIKSPVAASFYMTSYMTKDKSSLVGNVGLHLYYCSRGLNRRTHHMTFFDRDPFIDSLLVNKYDFCSTGFTHLDDDLDTDFCDAFRHSSLIDPVLRCPDVEDYIAFEQLLLKGF